ncbi:MAG TPA: response regulator [Thermomicrobiales bacterium]|jgi:CheY-like chemotaxis protein|nr:response regulator [Thermomicrobiales bacterium]
MASRSVDRAKLDSLLSEQQTRAHVFLIDSSPEFRELIAELLADERYGVTASDYIPSLFSLIVATQPDLLIIDLAVTHRSGCELLEQLEQAAITERVPVLVTSTDQRLIDRALENQARYDFEHYLVKPFDLDVLLDIVAELTDQ